MRLWPRRQGSSLDLLVVGLGNPGREYARNRHNVGQLVVDELARRHGGSWKSKFSGQIAEIRLDGHKVALLKPETFMNVSGLSSATLWPSRRISAICPENFDFHEPPCRRASSSTTSWPTLWRLRAYSRPGLPRPTTSRSSDEARSPRRHGRRTPIPRLPRPRLRAPRPRRAPRPPRPRPRAPRLGSGA